MGLEDDLRSGRSNVRFVAPPAWRVMKSDADFVQWMDEPRGLVWFAVRAPDRPLSLEPEDGDALDEDVRRYARDMFDCVFAAQPDPPVRGPRTSDPSWSPLVECSTRTLGGARFLHVIHRMTYQPGREGVMGHLVAPSGDGTIELRNYTVATTTGMRESALMMVAMNEQPTRSGDEVMRDLAAKGWYDDPRHDAAFPDHPLSRIRDGMRWLTDESGLRITPIAPRSRDCRVPGAWSATLPPRFLASSADASGATCVRTSYSAGTDALDQITIRRLGGIRVDGLEPTARAVALQAAADVHIEMAWPTADRLVCYRRFPLASMPDQHAIMDWHIDAAGQATLISYGASVSLPRETMTSRLAIVTSSYRAEPPKPWWRLW